MRKYILDQLRKITVAKINVDEHTYTYNIPKYTKPKFTAGKMYIIKVADELVNNPSTILAINWNSGRFPKNSYYKCYVTSVIGGNIKCDCLAINPITKQDMTEVFSGYLDLAHIEQLEEL